MCPIARASEPSVHEIIALGQRLTRSRRPAPVGFELARIDATRFVSLLKAPDKSLEHRAEWPRARTKPRLEDVVRTGFVDKLARRVHKAGKLRLFRLWKMLDPALLVGAPTRPFAEHIAWLRRSRRS
jgi:hypothetical protein